MESNKIVSKEEWISARKEFLLQEKKFTQLRDKLSADRRELPWYQIEKNYQFKGEKGTLSFAELFKGKSQLIIYHFMLGPKWEAGCPSCSYLADNFNGISPHLAARDISFLAVSRAPFERIQAFKTRMGWDFDWVSSSGSEFNFDFNVSFTEEEEKNKETYYNYGKSSYFAEEGPGASVFFKNDSGDIFHTYSTYARGLDILIGAYNYIDLTPKGRNEEGLPYPMAWVKHHDKY